MARIVIDECHHSLSPVLGRERTLGLERRKVNAKSMPSQANTSGRNFNQKSICDHLNPVVRKDVLCCVVCDLAAVRQVL